MSSTEVAQAAFCSYCGFPPPRKWAAIAYRVCMRCRSGMVLRTPPGAQPRYDDPFVIVDERLTVKAVSSQAEVLLLVDEPAASGVPLRTVGDPEIPSVARVSSCGPPSGAVVVLRPQAPVTEQTQP